MNRQKIITAFKNFQRLSGDARQQFFSAFEKKMIYRTTKTENPKTTPQMVKRVLSQSQPER